jgi:undecaprenyl-diphosphatase
MAKKSKQKNNNNIVSKILKNKLFRIGIILALIISLSFLLDKLGLNFPKIFPGEIFFEIFYILTLIGEPFVFIWIAAILTIILFVNNKKYFTFIFTIALTALLNKILKISINRPRPFEALQIDSVVPTTLSSFPSGHAMIMFSLVPILSESFSKWKYFFWTIAILVSLSRIYLGVHYVSDIVAGAILGYLTGFACLKISQKLGWKI